MQTTIEDVAQRAGVSIATVSRAFKHPDQVAAKTRGRVMAAAEELGFSISRSASVFQAGQTFRIALLLSERPSTWFNAHVYEGLNEVFHPAGYDISIFSIANRADRQRFFQDLPIRRNADAVVIPSFDDIDPEETARLQSIRMPIAGINALPEDSFTLSVSIDDEQGMHLATRHLIRLGHRDLVFIGLSERPDFDDSLQFSANRRVKGFTEECEANGITPTILYARKGEDVIDDAITQLTALPRIPDGICCQQDSLALPLMARLQQMGHHVPTQVSIVGFDDDDYARASGLTTIRQDPTDMGRQTARGLLTLIEGGTVAQPHRRIPVQLMCRNSSAPLR